MAKDRTGYVQTCKDGSIWARLTYVGSDGKRHQLRRRAKTRTEAREILKRLIRSLDDVGQSAIEGDRMRFRDLAGVYAEARLVPAKYHGDRKVAGLRSWKAPLGFLRTLVRHFGNRPIKSITHGELERYKATRLATPVLRGKDKETGEPVYSTRTIASVNRELALMRAVMRYAQRQGWINRSPFEMGAPIISIADETRRERVLTHDEERRLLDACGGRTFTYVRRGKQITGHDKGGRRSHLRALIIAAVDTAMRRGELFGLTWRDVDLEGRTLTVTAVNSKTARPRTVPMTPRLHSELEALWEQSPKDIDVLVFGVTNNVKTGFTAACKAAGIEGFRFHDFRHTAITRMIAARVPAAEVMKISGHTQTSTFLRYLNPTGSSLERAASLLSAFNEESGAVEQPTELLN